jgi:hypothetical protein
MKVVFIEVGLNKKDWAKQKSSNEIGRVSIKKKIKTVQAKRTN